MQSFYFYSPFIFNFFQRLFCLLALSSSIFFLIVEIDYISFDWLFLFFFQLKKIWFLGCISKKLFNKEANYQIVNETEKTYLLFKAFLLFYYLFYNYYFDYVIYLLYKFLCL